MPYVAVKVSCELTEEKELALKSKLGQAISAIPGKEERSTMICIEDKQKMYLGGTNDQPTAYIEVKIYGKSTREAYDAATAAFSGILEELLGISPKRTYINFSEFPIWGTGGKII